MKATKLTESSVFSEVRDSTSSQTTASDGRPGAAFSASLEDAPRSRVELLDGDRAALVDARAP